MEPFLALASEARRPRSHWIALARSQAWLFADAAGYVARCAKAARRQNHLALEYTHWPRREVHR
jgi:hypothetical protein